MITAADVKLVSLDGALTHRVRCPKCGTWDLAEVDQFSRKVSLKCGTEGCDFHHLQDLSELGSAK